MKRWPFKKIGNLHGNGFSLFVLVKLKNNFNVSFNDNYKIYCHILFS